MLHSEGAMENDKESEEASPRGLISHVFSWSIKDILNKNLYKNKVQNIPMRFSSISEYHNSFKPALIEETHADLLSGITSVSRAPVCQIISVEQHDYFNQRNNLLYKIKVKHMRTPVEQNAILLEDEDDDGSESDDGPISEDDYVPGGGDLIALVEVKPRCIDDLNRPEQPYTLAIVRGRDDDKINFSTSRPVSCFNEKGCTRDGKKIVLYGVYLINMTTNLRIQAALAPEEDNKKTILTTVVHGHRDVEETCPECLVDERSETAVSKTRPLVRPYGLNESQETAILNCVANSQCIHHNTLKLIWGPPGTGKTKTVGVLLSALLKLKTRTLICGPTNTAILQVAGRLLELVRDALEIQNYGLGDIILIGNKKRMSIDKGTCGLLDVFLDHRVQVLAQCFAPVTGWKGCLDSLIHLLENSEELYKKYLAEARENKILHGKDPQTYREFFMKELKPLSEGLKFCIENLPTHLPSSAISREVVERLLTGSDMLDSLEDCLSRDDSGALSVLQRIRLKVCVNKCLGEFQILQKFFSVPEATSEAGGLSNFCLASAFLIFCTASTAARLGEHSFRMLIIDEAAQLKECESLIPLQVSDLRHVVLIGDEKQLPAMVRSNIAENSNFGRSLFQRLVLMGHKKHLLNTQYRMHPSISRFPNKEFYDNQILDALSVRTRSYQRQFVEGKMYGTYSFINVSNGNEETDTGFSLINTMEVAVALAIVTKLSEACAARKEKVSVGVISPYKAQMYAIQNIFAKRFPIERQTWCSVNVRSVDAFQGGEDDVIIISTVRSNIRGSIGFLSNHQRTNVALTRARHCLWILGNGRTLSSSDSVWKKLILDAKKRDAFHNVEDDTGLSQFISDALLSLGRLDLLLDTNSASFKTAKWKMRFSDEFIKSMSRLAIDNEMQKSVLELLEKLSSGWRPNKTARDVNLAEGSTASELLELYKIKAQLYLAWSVDLQEENSNCIQIIKVWDIVWATQVQRLASRLDALVGNYTVNMLNRCKYKCMEGNIAIPGSWPSEKPGYHSDLSVPFASLSLGGNRNRNNKTRERW